MTLKYCLVHFRISNISQKPSIFLIASFNAIIIFERQKVIFFFFFCYIFFYVFPLALIAFIKCLLAPLDSIVYNCLLYKEYFLAFLLLWIFWPLLFWRILNLQIFFCQNVFVKGLQKDFSQSETSKYLIEKESKENSSNQFIDS